jgi:acetyltransferase
MVKYRRNQQQLLQVPPSLPQSFEPDRASATRLIDAAISEGREWLSEQEAKAVLKAYGIATVPTEIGGSAAAAGELAQQLCSTLPRNRSSRQRQT